MKNTGNLKPITLFLCGDVMTGRGIDQILPYPSRPHIYESWIRDARDYVELAEKKHGAVQKPVSFSYIWGEALEELERMVPDVRLINLETAVTTSEEYWADKGINYRMHPKNIPVLKAAKIDCCSLANNHTLDWGFTGLFETLDSLVGAGISVVGAGLTAEEARRPAFFEVPGRGRLLIFGLGSVTSGIPSEWGATAERPGVNLLSDLGIKAAAWISDWLITYRKPGDIIVLSVHWGSNWGYRIPVLLSDFAHALIDRGAVDLIHGHSSHHAKGVEIYKDRLILYGCGDFLTDYEGISGYEEFRGDLTLMYFTDIDPLTGKLTALRMVPIQIRQFQARRASRGDSLWLCETLNREGRNRGTEVHMKGTGELIVEWHH